MSYSSSDEEMSRLLQTNVVNEVPSNNDNQSNNRISDAEVIEEAEEDDMKYGASTVVSLFVPVSICMAVVVATITSISYFSDQSGGEYLVYTPFHSDNASTGQLILETIGNSLIIIGVIVVMTLFLVVLYKYRCYKVIHGWLIFSSLILLFIFALLYLKNVLVAYNIPFDYISTAFIIWNFGVVGMLCIHWKGVLQPNQFTTLIVLCLQIVHELTKYLFHLKSFKHFSYLFFFRSFDLTTSLSDFCISFDGSCFHQIST